MTIEKSINNKKATLVVVGRLDTTTAPQLEQEITSLTEVESLVLDFKGLEYISSAGLRTILMAHKSFSNKGGIEVCNVNEAVMDVFTITGFSEVITIK